jgi:hypothetical protein
MISRRQGVDNPPASSVAGTSANDVVQRIAERYGLTAAHRGRSGTDAGVWGVDQHGWVTFVEVSASLSGRRALGGPLALVVEDPGHGDAGVEGDLADARAVEAVTR